MIVKISNHQYFWGCRTDLNWKTIFGVALLGGIGFTMSIFVTLLAFDNEIMINNSKLVILISSLTAGLLGFITLKLTLKQKRITKTEKGRQVTAVWRNYFVCSLLALE